MYWLTGAAAWVNADRIGTAWVEQSGSVWRIMVWFPDANRDYEFKSGYSTQAAATSAVEDLLDKIGKITPV